MVDSALIYVKRLLADVPRMRVSKKGRGGEITWGRDYGRERKRNLERETEKESARARVSELERERERERERGI